MWVKKPTKNHLDIQLDRYYPKALKRTKYLSVFKAADGSNTQLKYVYGNLF